MKNLLLLSSYLLFTLVSYAQIPKGYIVKDVLVDNQLVVVQKKNKMGIFSLKKNEFDVKPKKVFISYIERNNCVFIADVKNGVEAFYIDEALNLVSIVKDEKEVVFGYENSKGNHHYGRKVFNIHDSWKELPEQLTDLTDLEIEQFNGYLFRSEKFGIRIHGKLIEVFDYRNEGEEYDIPLVDHNGEDSIAIIDGDFFYVYPPNDPPIQKSGVWSTLENNWVIQPENKDVFWMNDYCFVFNGYYTISGESFTQNEVNSFDLYRFDKDEIVESKKGIISNSEIPCQDILTQKVLLRSQGPNIVIYEENGKKGLMIMNLFNHFGSGEYYYQGNESFSFRIILNPEFDEIYPSGHENKFYTKKDGEYNLYEYGEDRWYTLNWTNYMYQKYGEYGNFLFNLDGEMYIDNHAKMEDCSNSEFICLQKVTGFTPFKDDFSNMGMEVLNDSLVYIKYHEPEQEIGLPYANIWGEDSIFVDIDGNEFYVYPAPDPGEYKSGILNINTYKWIVEPTNKWVLKHELGYLICKPVLVEYDNIKRVGNKEVYVYDFKMNDGSFKFQDISEEQLQNEYAHFMISNSNADELLPSEDLSPGFVYYGENGKMGLANLSKRKVIAEPRTYLKTFERNAGYVWIADKKVYNESETDFISIDNNQLVIEKGKRDLKLSLEKPFNLKLYKLENGNAFKPHIYKVVYKDSIAYIQDGERYYNEIDTVYDKEKSTYELILKNENNFKGRLTNGEVNDKRIYFEIDNLSDDYLLITDYVLGFYDSYALVDQYGYDSIDADGYTVYAYEEGFQHSGLYSKEQAKWIVPRKYISIQQIGDLFYAEKYKDATYSFDVFNKNGDVIRTLATDIIKEDPALDGVDWFNYLAYWIDDHKLHFSSYSQNETFDLNSIDHLIVDDKCDLSRSKKFTGYTEHWFHQISNKDTVTIHPNVSDETNWQSKWRADNEIPFSKFEVHRMNDSLIYIRNFQEEFHDNMPLVDMWFEDSIDFDGNYVYPNAIEAKYKSGIYNLKTFSWTVTPIFRDIQLKEDKFIASLTDDEGKLLYHIFKLDGTFIEKKTKQN